MRIAASEVRALLSAIALLGCSCETPQPAGDAGIDSGTDAGLDAGRDGGRDAGRDAGPQDPGWIAIEGLPDGCVIERATYPDRIYTPEWEACGTGCSRHAVRGLGIGVNYNIGYFDGERGWYDVVLADDAYRITALSTTSASVTAFRSRAPGPSPTCYVSARSYGDRHAAFSIYYRPGSSTAEHMDFVYRVSLDAPSDPLIPIRVLAPDVLMGSSVQSTAVSAQVVAAVFQPSAIPYVIWEGGFRDLLERPDVVGYPQDLQVVGDHVLFADVADVTRIAHGSPTEGPAIYYDGSPGNVRAMRTDGEWIAWMQVYGPFGAYTRRELWAARYVRDPSLLAPRMLRELAVYTNTVAVGAGMYAVALPDPSRLEIFDLADGRRRRYLAPDGWQIVEGPLYLSARETMFYAHDRAGSFTLFRVDPSTVPYDE